jgi:metal-dependent amidase/aminoacylase/carboxypeptidase family protein
MEAGLFRDVDAAMMIHGRCGTQVWRPSLGIIKVKAEFFGRAAHAASWPWRGANALNAVIQLFVTLDAMRQQLRPDARVHGVIREGGAQPNIKRSSICAPWTGTIAWSDCAASRPAPMERPRPPAARRRSLPTRSSTSP